MKKLSLVVVSAVALALTSCSKEPKACFNVEVQTPEGKWVKSTTGKVGEMFYFSTICSQNAHATGTEYDYGDGSKGQDANHNYVKPGSYTVKCTVYAPKKGEKGDKSDVASQTIVVKDLQASK